MRTRKYPKYSRRSIAINMREDDYHSRADVNMHTSINEEVEMVKHSPDSYIQRELSRKIWRNYFTR